MQVRVIVKIMILIVVTTRKKTHKCKAKRKNNNYNNCNWKLRNTNRENNINNCPKQNNAKCKNKIVNGNNSIKNNIKRGKKFDKFSIGSEIGNRLSAGHISGKCSNIRSNT